MSVKKYIISAKISQMILIITFYDWFIASIYAIIEFQLFSDDFMHWKYDSMHVLYDNIILYFLIGDLNPGSIEAVQTYLNPKIYFVHNSRFFDPRNYLIADLNLHQIFFLRTNKRTVTICSKRSMLHFIRKDPFFWSVSLLTDPKMSVSGSSGTSLG